MLKYNSELYLNKKNYSKVFNLFINSLLGSLLKRGNKLRALKSIFKLRFLLKLKSKREPNFILLYAIYKGILKIYFIKKRFGKVFKEIPMPLNYKRRIRFIVKSFLKYSKSKITNENNINNLSNIILITCKKKGPLIRANIQAYRKAFANRSLLHLIKK